MHEIGQTCSLISFDRVVRQCGACAEARCILSTTCTAHYRRVQTGVFMHLKRFLPVIIASFFFGCASAPVQTQSATSDVAQSSAEAQPEQELTLDSSNPFAHDNTLPYQAPEYDKIRTEHFVPALKFAMAEQKKEIDAIANQTAAPTFENTLVAMQKTGQRFMRVAYVFDNMTNAYTNDELKKAEEEMAPLFSAHNDEIYLNDKLFARIDALYNDRANLGLDSESMRLLELTHEDFLRAGAKLSAADKEKIKQMNAEISSISTKFGQNILSEMNSSAVLVDTREELAGLSDAEIAAAADAAKARGNEGKYLIVLRNTSVQPILASLENRALRERVHKASLQRGMRGNEADNRDLVARVLKLKAERAKMLGYSSHAAYKVEDQCAKTVDAVNAMLGSMVDAARASLEREAAELQAVIDAQKGGFKLEAWDWPYYAEQLRKQKYAIDENQLKPYFELNTVIEKGVFYAAGKLYGLKFVERKDLPVYDPDVRVWEVFDEDGTAVGLFYGDYYARDNKRGGAWMSEYVQQSKLLGTKPVILNQINVTKPASGPTLLTTDEVTTLFHEFGHALHGLLSNVTYPEFSGTNVPRDFVEFPSQFNEVWAFWPEVLDNYAVHYETGEKIPAELVQKLKDSEKFNQGYATAEYLGAAMLDQAWYQFDLEHLPVITRDGFEALEHQLLAGVKLDIPTTPPRYRTTYFNHIFANSYDAGYYAYIWSEVLDADAVQWFKEHGLSRETGQKLRDNVLSRGNSVDPMMQYKNFADREPSSDYLLIRRGLKSE